MPSVTENLVKFLRRGIEIPYGVGSLPSMNVNNGTFSIIPLFQIRFGNYAYINRSFFVYMIPQYSTEIVSSCIENKAKRSPFVSYAMAGSCV